MENKANGTIDALAYIVKNILSYANCRLDGFVQTEENEAVLFIEMVDFDGNGTERYVELMKTDLLTAGHLASVLNIEIEYNDKR
jgi:hypothetical protein